eukprot:CAMPEP_0183702070 /NCGR_PEP_ID=MMETSP0737-20130205/292_1 /TAXON_ID=385413 /ORGANISM="Thalassiosira miniscula, Strain CCMP1093" /LENGTH=145 /DNA_ID=CAMNT_0025928607 /DNA_START=601 /DNA_END=1038 /DNA_ORIENTATION=-
MGSGANGLSQRTLGAGAKKELPRKRSEELAGGRMLSWPKIFVDVVGLGRECALPASTVCGAGDGRRREGGMALPREHRKALAGGRFSLRRLGDVVRSVGGAVLVADALGGARLSPPTKTEVTAADGAAMVALPYLFPLGKGEKRD